MRQGVKGGSSGAGGRGALALAFARTQHVQAARLLAKPEGARPGEVSPFLKRSGKGILQHPEVVALLAQDDVLVDRMRGVGVGVVSHSDKPATCTGGAAPCAEWLHPDDDPTRKWREAKETPWRP